MTKEEILEKALELMESGGWKELSVRKLSEQIHYSTIKIYAEFGSMGGLMEAIQQFGFNKLKARLNQVKANVSEDQLLKSISLEFWEFADQNRHFFQLMFSVSGAPDFPNKSKNNEIVGFFLWEMVTPIIPKDNLPLMYNWWSLMYGHILTDSLEIFDRVTHRKMFESSIDRFIKTL